MKRRQALLLTFICVVALLTSIQSVAQENPSPVTAEKRAEAQQKLEAARVEAQKKRAEAQEKRAAARAEAQKKRIVAKTEAKQKRALTEEKRALAQAKRATAHAAMKEKRVAARAAAEAKRAIAQSMRKAMPPDGTFKFLGSRPNFDVGNAITGAPYSATAVTEHTQTLGDGNKIIQKNEATYYRDSEGRIRIDQKLKTIGKWSAAGEAPSIITIWDPVAGRQHSLDPRTRTAVTTIRKPRVSKSREKPGTDLNQQKTPTQVNVKVSDANKGVVGRVASQEVSDRRRTKESLGKQVIQGVAAEGTRLTLTIPANEIGNVLPINVVDESWYSPELQIRVMTRHHDPRSGDTVYRLTNINRSEPSRALFDVPADYRIVDRSGPRVPAKIPEVPKQPEPAPKPEKNL